MTNDDREERVPVDGSTAQGELVAAHWARLSLTVDGAMQALRSRGIAIEQATADDLHGLDMLHMGGLAATDALAEMAALQTGQHARMGLRPGAFRDTSAEGQQYHLANIKAMQQALAQEEGTHGRSVDVTRMRLQTATSMERNLRERRLQVAMVVYRRTRDMNAA
jgi:hypothetical protein